MRGLAKQSRHIMMFTELNLLSFGRHLLKKHYGVSIQPTEEDFYNWKDIEQPNPFQLPSRFQIGDEVLFYYITEGRAETFPAIGAFILAVHFYEGKVKYDLELQLGEYKSRIYNVDSALVTDTPQLTT